MIFQTYSPDNARHQQAASQIEDWSRQAGSAMLPLDADRTVGFRRRLLAFDSIDQSLLGHVALVMQGNHNSMLSGLVINPVRRSQGIATVLLRQMVSEVSLLTGNLESFTSYVNDDALQAYKNIGAEVVGIRTGKTSTDCVNIVDLMPALRLHRNDSNDIVTSSMLEPSAPRLILVSGKSNEAA